MKSAKKPLFLLITLLCLAACDKSDRKSLDTPTGGSVTIAVDETLGPLIEAEKMAFEGLYEHANLNVIYTTEADAVDLLIKDSVRTAVLPRKLSQKEEEFIQQVKIYPTATKIASDAIVFIVNANNADTTITYEQLQDILAGKISLWKELNPETQPADGKIQLVFDHTKSSTLRHLNDTVGITENRDNFFALQDNKKVVEYVAQNQNALGVIGLSWISDGDDPLVVFSHSQIKVVSISNPNEAGFHQPYQATLAQGLYPLQRSIYVVGREARAGLGYGFTAFLANEIGQRIILKSGLLPATMPTRLVEISNEPLGDN